MRMKERIRTRIQRLRRSRQKESIVVEQMPEARLSI